ncbi:MAG TPA: LacI family DNA-binding transcriptional regulator [Lachnospiraceae bacterium]|nr:LacI family DNA-binding transcriptional regulator [Lachnospiraceae bacterium]
MITIKEISKILGLSTTTVSNVIHGKTGEVSPETILKVRDILDKYDYVPNISARNLAQNESKIIGLAMKSRSDKYENFIKDPFVSELIGGIEKTVRRLGYFMMIYISNDVADLLKQVSTWNADGLLLLGMLGDDGIRIHEKYKKPFVCIDTYYIPEFHDFVNIGLEDEKGTYDIVKYMIDCGHRKIAFFADNCIGVDYERFKGYRKALKQAGIRYEEKKDFFMFRPGPEEREKSFEELCSRSSEYTAMFCASDYYAILMMNELSDRGIRVPQDISVAGFDDNLLAQLHRPALTTVHQDVEGKGIIAAETLVKMIKGEKIRKRSLLLPTELRIRESVCDLKSAK